ncbi:MAG TPA: molybdopterin molybdenumtransferase MoeA [Aliiroseovarius sp.]|nr:molybdopterin molybdenumtransferase MoeA [Aliiroseovarius sp.]
MIPVSDALGHIFSLVSVLDTETVPLADASGRVLAQPAIANRDQPPFAASVMDGYALNGVEADPEAMFRVIGTSAAGHRFSGRVGPGECVRIFTGAPVPDGASRVIIQEDTTRKGDVITLARDLDEGPYIRPAGADFAIGDRVEAGRILGPSDLALLAAMNVPALTVRRRPVVAIMATGDELVMPGDTPGPDQIIASNNFGLKALVEANGGQARLLPIARDNEASLKQAFALAEGADLVVTIGGASVGDHDIVADVAASLGMEQRFYKIAMRPGKPLMAGRMQGATMLGLPGNPVSAMVCGHVFLVPALRAMLGLGQSPAPRLTAPLAEPVAANGGREHYMRARLTPDGIRPFARQDSALLSVLAQANALLIRPVNDPARSAGESVAYLPL